MPVPSTARGNTPIAKLQLQKSTGPRDPSSTKGYVRGLLGVQRDRMMYMLHVGVGRGRLAVSGLSSGPGVCARLRFVPLRVAMEEREEEGRGAAGSSRGGSINQRGPGRHKETAQPSGPECYGASLGLGFTPFGIVLGAHVLRSLFPRLEPNTGYANPVS